MSSDVGSSNDDTTAGQNKRYVVSEEQAGTWRVIDLSTGLPAASDGREFIQLCARDANDLADELNRCDAEGGESPLL